MSKLSLEAAFLDNLERSSAHPANLIHELTAEEILHMRISFFAGAAAYINTIRQAHRELKSQDELVEVARSLEKEIREVADLSMRMARQRQEGLVEALLERIKLSGVNRGSHETEEIDDPEPEPESRVGVYEVTKNTDGSASAVVRPATEEEIARFNRFLSANDDQAPIPSVSVKVEGPGLVQ